MARQRHSDERGRRDNGEGTIAYSKKYEFWIAQLPPDAQGKRPKRRAKTKSEALIKLREMRAARNAGINLSAKRMKIDPLLDVWLEAEVKRTVGESTHASYEQISRLYIRPTFGDRWADEVTTLAIQNWVNALLDRHTVNVVRNAYARLRAALDAGLRWSENTSMTKNPAIGVKLPRMNSEPKTLPGPADIRRWLDATANHRLGTLYLMAALLGLRIGELIGLSWRHYNRQAATLTIEQQIRPVRNKLMTGKTKNRQTRTLPATRILAERLDAHWKRLESERSGRDWHEHDLIFPSERGTPLNQSNVNRHLRETLQMLELPHWSMHTFRHFQATRLTELGISEHVIGAILGHTPGRNITRRYAHVTVDAMRSALQMLETDLLRRAV